MNLYRDGIDINNSFNRPFVKITNLCIPYNLLNIPHLPSVGDFDEWAIKLKITTYLGDYSLG